MNIKDHQGNTITPQMWTPWKALSPGSGSAPLPEISSTSTQLLHALKRKLESLSYKYLILLQLMLSVWGRHQLLLSHFTHVHTEAHNKSNMLNDTQLVRDRTADWAQAV